MVSPIAAGLLNVVSEEGKAAKARRETSEKEGSTERMLKLEAEIRQDYAMRMEEWKQDRTKELKTWELDEADKRKQESAKRLQEEERGLLGGSYADQINKQFGSQVTGEDTRDLSPAAREAYGIKEQDEAGLLRLRRQAAMNIGDTEAEERAGRALDTEVRRAGEERRLDAQEGREKRADVLAGLQAEISKAALAEKGSEKERKKEIETLTSNYLEYSRTENTGSTTERTTVAQAKERVRDRLLVVAPDVLRLLEGSSETRTEKDEYGDAKTITKETPGLANNRASKSTGALTIPAKGDVRSGYRFKGGDPNNRNSWEKV